MLHHRHLFLPFYILIQHRFNGCIIFQNVDGLFLVESILHWTLSLQDSAIVINVAVNIHVQNHDCVFTDHLYKIFAKLP